MDVRDAAALIAPAIRHHGRTWADLGAGAGTFTRALASLLGPAGCVYAVERDRGAVARLRAIAKDGRDAASAQVVPVHGDFTRPMDLPPLDGALFANALHFVSAAGQAEVLRRIARGARAGGQIVVVEYEKRGPSRWVPYPVSLARLAELAREAELGAPVSLGTRPSAFGGTLYAAAMTTSLGEQTAGPATAWREGGPRTAYGAP
jgi:SAM-dependent methyltransferase